MTTNLVLRKSISKTYSLNVILSKLMAPSPLHQAKNNSYSIMNHGENSNRPYDPFQRVNGNALSLYQSRIVNYSFSQHLINYLQSFAELVVGV